MSPGPLPHSLIVTGDVLTDRHLYTGERSRPKLANRRGMISVSEAGGAAIVYRLLDSIVGQDKTRGAVCSDWTVHLMHEASTQSGYAVWSPRPLGPEEPDKKTMVWRTKELLGYGCATGGDTIQKTSDEGVPEKCGIMIIDDAGLGFRHRADGDFQALLDRLHCNGVLLLKMSERAGREGPENLWRFLSTKDWRHPATDGAGAENSPKRQTLVGLISARDLRREPLGLDAGLSWEATLDDLRIALHERGTTSFLRSCTHLIVTFSADAAVWLDQSDPSNPKVIACLDPARAEGEWGGRLEGDVIGYHAAMTAAIATGIIRYIDAKEPREALNFGIPMEAGLVAMRQLRRLGHGEVTNIPPAGYPHERLAKQIRDIRSEPARMEARFRHFELNWTQRFDGPGPDWNLIVDEQRRLVPLGQPPLVHLAKQVVLYGTQALEHLPHAKFGSLITADRRVIEALRNIRRQMQAYHANPKPERPLNIAVFGPPGAGKSFGVKQLSNEVFGKDAWRLFNLSQFENNQDLNGAFHQVRDAALSGITPVVFWDEFDSHELDWLQYLLAPMQDGRFQDRQLNHGILNHPLISPERITR